MMPLLEYHLDPSVRAFSTLRNSGGQGEGAYAKFNITPYCGDDPANIIISRRALCQELSIEDEDLISPIQTHSNRALTIDSEFLRLSIVERAELLQDIDALITREEGICIGVSTADCLPILLYDATTHTIAAVHAGWRGLVNGIICNTICQCETLGTSVSALKVVIGPSIAQASFEVGEEVVTAFIEAGFPEGIIHRNPTRPLLKPHIDLWGAACFELCRAGIELTNIQIAGVDTYTHTDSFFSARRLGGKSGRIFNGIMLRSKATEAK